jgi:hypothetical protein
VAKKLGLPMGDGGRIRLTYPIGIRIERLPMRDIYYYTQESITYN